MEWLFIVFVLFFVAATMLFTTYAANGQVVYWSRALENRRIAQGAFRLLQSVTGRRRGREVSLNASSGGRFRLRVEAAGSGDMIFRERGLLGELARLIRSEKAFLDRFAVEADVRGTRQLMNKAQEEAADLERQVTEALDACKALRVPELRFEKGWLIADGIQSFESAAVLALTDAMIALADDLSGAAALGARVRAVSRDLRICPFCRDGLDDGRGDEVHSCEVCQAVHHQSCWDEHGGCSIFGCRRGARTPADQREAVS